MEPTVADELAMINIKRRQLWLLEKRQKERLAEIEERLAALAGDMEPGSLHLQRVKCGPNCKCNNGTGHGPYYFLYRWTPGGQVKRYVRKSEVERIRRRLSNYREYRVLAKEAHSIEEFLDVGVAIADIRLGAKVTALLEKTVKDTCRSKGA
ncbi:DUF6788 family protein [Symbiobacterium thermophilum]|uniref:DUF6788 domain-containing protein n=1 Tax=Symbiobacterium thermophilum TaxID=2734 RepID=A0A953IC33_SYMTR|nr:DUF6788 family protein [Symbiobacterium thermophilum]MBY6278263.1 hypothetical protein [Symbiobacterium thermophilum]